MKEGEIAPVRYAQASTAGSGYANHPDLLQNVLVFEMPGLG